MNVNETWGDGQIFSVNGVGARSVDGADCCDLTVFDSDIGAEGWSTSSVEEGAIFDNEVEGGWGGW